jgi:hypothetical protein
MDTLTLSDDTSVDQETEESGAITADRYAFTVQRTSSTLKLFRGNKSAELKNPSPALSAMVQRAFAHKGGRVNYVVAGKKIIQIEVSAPQLRYEATE